jgi:hypothetical protein
MAPAPFRRHYRRINGAVHPPNQARFRVQKSGATSEFAPATIQTYLSFLRGLALWTGKRGLVRKPEFYGLRPEQYKRHAAADYDKSFSAHGIDIGALLAKICAYDPYVGAMLRLMWAFGLRRKEAITSAT